jgi:hypothetical protein
MVPSMSEITTWKSESHRNIRAEHVEMPEYDEVTENEMVLTPGERLRDFSWSDVSRSVLAYDLCEVSPGVSFDHQTPLFRMQSGRVTQNTTHRCGGVLGSTGRKRYLERIRRRLRRAHGS